MALKKYFKIYSHYFRFSLMAAIIYRTNFLVQLIVEFGYIFLLLFFIQVVYGNVREIAGWNYLEMLFLIGCTIVFSELFVALFYVWGFRVLPEKIKNGEIDFVLVKPVHSLFALSLGRPYVASFISMIPGFYLMFYAFLNLHFALNPVKILLAFLVFVCGLIIAYSISVMLTALSFIFINANFLPDFAFRLLDFGQNPQQVYNHIILKAVFFFILPVVFVASVPSSIMIKEFNLSYFLLAFLLAIIFLSIALKIWNRLIRNYTSASS